MDEVVKHFLTTLGTAGALLVVFAWWLQKYIDRRLIAHFNALEARLKGEAATALVLRKKRLERTGDLLPTLQHAASECRSRARELASNITEKDILLFWEKRESYVDNLYGAQLLLFPETYEAAHRFKSVLDGISILVGEKVEDSRKEEVLAGLKRSVGDLDRFYAPLKAALRKEFHMLEQLPRMDEE
jgi:hypothetical protein